MLGCKFYLAFNSGQPLATLFHLFPSFTFWLKYLKHTYVTSYSFIHEIYNVHF